MAKEKIYRATVLRKTEKEVHGLIVDYNKELGYVKFEPPEGAKDLIKEGDVFLVTGIPEEDGVDILSIDFVEWSEWVKHAPEESDNSKMVPIEMLSAEVGQA